MKGLVGWDAVGRLEQSPCWVLGVKQGLWRVLGESGGFWGARSVCGGALGDQRGSRVCRRIAGKQGPGVCARVWQD